ncbi:MAG: hypothetical protein ACRD3F_01130 [Acidobacteriaceae bacterium]
MVLFIETSKLLVEVLPKVGGKVAQIRYRPLDYDLLIPPQRPYRTIPHAGDWLAHDTSGMDDCFPNIAAGQYPGDSEPSIMLPDLGEWTHGSWDVLDADQNVITMRRRGRSLPYLAYKTIKAANDDTLEFSYRVENQGRIPMRYMWSAHPLIRVPEEYRLIVPGEGVTFRTFPADGAVYSWPNWKGVNLGCDWITAGSTLKVFLTGLREGRCALQMPHCTIQFTFPWSTTPVLGIWLNNHGFPLERDRAFRCIAVEPCTSPTDLLDDLDDTAYPSILARGTAEWSFQLRILPAR